MSQHIGNNLFWCIDSISPSQEYEAHHERDILVVDAEAMLNSHLLTYMSSDDVEEPLTPLVGHKILTPVVQIMILTIRWMQNTTCPEYSSISGVAGRSTYSNSIAHVKNKWCSKTLCRPLQHIYPLKVLKFSQLRDWPRRKPDDKRHVEKTTALYCSSMWSDLRLWTGSLKMCGLEVL